MKLSDIKPLRENAVDYVVFKVSSPNSDQVYYGYSMGEDVKKAFMVGAKRQDNPDRGDVRMINSAGGDVENLNFELVDVFANEIEAFMERNDLRAKDAMSITGPSNFPGQVYQRALKDHPERVGRWKLDKDLNNMTARQAMGNGAFSMDALTAITAANPKLKPQIVADLDGMMYPEFKTKYSLK